MKIGKPCKGSVLVLVLTVLALFAASLASSTGASAATRTCQRTDSDSDGDGWGWENGQSCRVDPGSGSGSNNGGGSPCIDSDGDGYGWDGTKTCDPSKSGDGEGNNTNTNTNNNSNNNNNGDGSPCIDSDGDGYGWDGTKTCDPTKSGDGGNNNTNTNVRPPTNNDIIILFAGQSNAIGERTKASSTVVNGKRVATGSDASDSRVKVFTDDGKWETAELCSQVWLRWKRNNTHPQKNSRGGDDSCGVHPGFHMAKRIAQRTDRSVYLIPTAEDGQPIEEWIGSSSCRQAPGGYDNSPGGMSTIHRRLNAALGPNGPRVDVVGWVQGEANADKGAGAIEGHECKVQQLQTQLTGRAQIDGFSQNQTHFVASTIKPVDDGYKNINTSLQNLANRSGWFHLVDARGYGTVSDGIHYNTSATRQLGQQMGQKYVDGR